ncbi:MAG: branched-chain amino acid ABC transporter permease [Lautropia sp.]
MSLDLLAQVIASGLTNGFLYALVGLGLAVIYKGSTIINAAQGDFAIVGAIVAVVLTQKTGMPYWTAIVAGMLGAVLAGALVELLCIRPMLRRQASEESMLLVTVGIAFLIGAIVLVGVGKAAYFLPPIGGEVIVEIGPAILQRHALIAAAAVVVFVAGLAAFYKYTHIGQSMVAASSDADGAASIGINVPLMRTLTFMLGGLIGGIAGILQTPLIGVSFAIGIAITLKGLAAAIIGGLTNPMGAVAGGLILGVAEALAVLLFSSGYQNIVAMGLLIVIMIAMPNGLFAVTTRKGG